MLQENDIQEYKDLFRQHFHREIEEETAANEACILVSFLEQILYGDNTHYTEEVK